MKKNMFNIQVASLYLIDSSPHSVPSKTWENMCFISLSYEYDSETYLHLFYLAFSLTYFYSSYICFGVPYILNDQTTYDQIRSTPFFHTGLLLLSLFSIDLFFILSESNERMIRVCFFCFFEALNWGKLLRKTNEWEEEKRFCYVKREGVQKVLLADLVFMRRKHEKKYFWVVFMHRWKLMMEWCVSDCTWVLV